MQFAVCSLQFAVCSMQFAVCNILTANCLLPTVHRLLFFPSRIITNSPFIADLLLNISINSVAVPLKVSS